MSKTASRATVLSSAEIRLLMEIGLMSCGAGNTTAAESIFLGLQSLRPDEVQSFIGLAMARIEAGAAQDAVSLLRGAARFRFAGTIEYKIFLAISLIAAGGRYEAERVLRQLLAEAPNECPEQKLAQALLARHGMDAHVIDSSQTFISNKSTVPYRTA